MNAEKTVGVEPFGARAAAILAFSSGILYFLAFPGVDIWPLGFVALAPLIVALRGQAPRRAAWIGWIAGFTMTMCGFYWLLEMLETFSGFGLPLCVLFMAILCAYQAGRIALLGFLCARGERKGWPFGLTFVLGFVASEQVFPLLFPWFYAATVHPIPALVQLAELGGPILVALPLVAVNFAIAELVFARRETRRVRRRLVAALLTAPAVAALYGVVRIGSVDARVEAAPKGRVGLVQANMSLFGKRKEKAEGLRRHLSLTHELAREGPLDLVVWSETSVMGAVREQDVGRAIPERFSREIGVPALFGAVLVKPVADEREFAFYNSALLTDAAGDVKGRYDKQFLLAFGEYIPFGETFPALYRYSPNSSRFTPGTSLQPLTGGEHEIATFICYEDIVPGFVNSIVRNGNPDLLVNLTNDAWFGDTTEPWIHLALAKLRAVEHRRYFVRSTNSGVSAIIDPVGRVVAHTDTFHARALAHTVAWLRGSTLYEVLGDVPFWLVSLAAAYAALRPPPRRAA
ncbi:MAG TPA: apolipoprotein N-acyltransferase, partial [Polyangiaceae bacterium]|nr:apolipoprotein N-acyltransferase [Polyangiaceae bacterium]